MALDVLCQIPMDHYQPFLRPFLQSNFSPLSLEKFERQTVALEKMQELDLGLSFTVSVAACQQVPKVLWAWWSFHFYKRVKYWPDKLVKVKCIMCLAHARCSFTFSEILFSLGLLNAPIKWPDFFFLSGFVWSWITRTFHFQALFQRLWTRFRI